MRILREIFLAFKIRFIIMIFFGNLLVALLPVVIWNTYSGSTIASNPAIVLNGDTFFLMQQQDPQVFGTLGPFRSLITSGGLESWGDLVNDGILPTSIIFSIILYLLFWAFITGGILGHWRGGERLTFSRFGTDGWRLFPANLLLLVVQSAAIYLIYQGIIVHGDRLITRFTDPAPSQILHIIFHLIPPLLFLIILAWLKITFDFCRVIIASPEKRPLLLSLFDGLTTSFRRLPSAFLYLLTLVVIVLAMHLIWTQALELLEESRFILPAHALFMVVKIWFALAWWKGLTYLRADDELSL